MFALLLAALPLMVSPSVPSAHASPATGTVCITTSTSATSCPRSPPTIGPLSVNDNFTVGVFIQGSDAMGGFDIYVAADPAYLTPTNATLGTVIAGPSLTSICVNGSALTGACTPNTANGPGVVEVSTAESSGENECGGTSPCSGMAFNITYRVISFVTSTNISYPSNPSCSTSSVGTTDTCVLVADNTGTPLSETVQGATVRAPAFDYSLSNSGPISITHGSSGTVTITATLTSVATQSVTLSCVSSSLPPGITCSSFTVNPVIPTATSDLTINVASSVMSGSYSFNVTGSPLGATTAPTIVSVSVPSATTTTSVACSPGSITTGSATSCTVTVTDTSSSPSIPTGSVSLSTDSTGTFSSNSCTLATSTSSVASCSVSYTPSVVGSGTHLITANYSGDSSHASSNGSSPLTVTSPATAPAILGLSPTVFYIIVGIAVIVLVALSLLALRRRGRTPQQ